ncbi:DUF983 domain-containing protein [Pararcticibacter amylolyticus]|nr:DUF983 domain-containing protein [Pararcticibacter amylolyticus]
MNTSESNDKMSGKRNTQYYPAGEFASALQAKCPRCRRGDLFASPMYGWKAQKMHSECSHCGMKFEKEPGYWYVSMFISYAMNVAELISLAVALYVFTGNLEDPYLYVGVLFAGVLLLSPFNYRYSRVILLYWLTPGLHFDPEKSKD